MPLPTSSGYVTRGEVYTKILYHLDELRDLCATMSHLHNTEDHHGDVALARQWHVVAEFFKNIRKKVTELATGALQ